MPETPSSYTAVAGGDSTPLLHEIAASAGEGDGDGRLLFGKYEVGRLLGRGAFAKVYYARDVRNGQSVAIKSISKRQIVKGGHVANIKREIAIMHHVHHAHIIGLLEVLATRTRIYFVMEYARGGELFTKVARGRFSEDLSRRYFQQLISAVGYCHVRGVFHRDLKPENLLLDENWNLKISDFGLSAVRDQIRPDGRLHTLCGTPAYVAPEVLAKKGYDGAKVDVWSCGVVLFVLNAGYLPFNDGNLMAMYRKIYRGEFRCPRWTSSELKSLLSRLLDPNPDTRITIDEIMDDPWFNKDLKDVEFHGRELDALKLEEDRDENVRFMNAFDIISHSSGCQLSGLFRDFPGAGGVAAARDQEEIFVSSEDPETIVEMVAAAVEGVEGVTAERKDWRVRVEGQDGNFAIVLGVNRLTEELVVIEVKMREKGTGPGGSCFWRETLRPLISGLVYQPGGPAAGDVTD